MRIRIVLLVILALYPWQVDAQQARITLVSVDRGTFCQSGGDLPWYHPRSTREAACSWAADLNSALRSDWGYKVGATLFIVGNAITFSFPIWAALGADAYTVTAVIVVGEAIDVVGIYVLGEEAFHDLKEAMREMANQWSDRIDQWGTHIDRLGSHIDRLGAHIDRLKRSSWAWS
jgi:hypothetical protein